MPEDLVPEEGANDDDDGGLTDEQVVSVLAALRDVVPELPAAEVPHILTGIAALECVAAARGLDLPCVATEPMLPALARDRLFRAIAGADAHAAGRAIGWLNAAELWFACRRIREQPREFRIQCWYHVLHRLDVLLISRAAADGRLQALAKLHADPDDLEAYLTECIGSMFAVIQSGRGTPSS